jgi:hypothetical protein
VPLNRDFLIWRLSPSDRSYNPVFAIDLDLFGARGDACKRAATFKTLVGSVGHRYACAVTVRGLEIRFLNFDRRRVAYAVIGDGPPLVAPAWWVSHLELDWRDRSFASFWESVGEVTRWCCTTDQVSGCPTARSARTN